MNGIIIDDDFYEWQETIKGCRNCNLWGFCNIGRYGFEYCEVISKNDEEGAFKYRGQVEIKIKEKD